MRDAPVTVVGTLVSDMRPRRVGPDGALVLNFRVACNERRFDKASESWMDGESLFSVSCWRRLSVNAASLVKGDPVIVRGKVRRRGVDYQISAGDATLSNWRPTRSVRICLAALSPCVNSAARSLRVRKARTSRQHLARPARPCLTAIPWPEVSLSELAEAARPLVPVPA